MVAGPLQPDQTNERNLPHDHQNDSISRKVPKEKVLSKKAQMVPWSKRRQFIKAPFASLRNPIVSDTL